jgi:hypothetical protein
MASATPYPDGSNRTEGGPCQDDLRPAQGFTPILAYAQVFGVGFDAFRTPGKMCAEPVSCRVRLTRSRCLLLGDPGRTQSLKRTAKLNLRRQQVRRRRVTERSTPSLWSQGWTLTETWKNMNVPFL